MTIINCLTKISFSLIHIFIFYSLTLANGSVPNSYYHPDWTDITFDKTCTTEIDLLWDQEEQIMTKSFLPSDNDSTTIKSIGEINIAHKKFSHPQSHSFLICPESLRHLYDILLSP